MDKSIIDIRDDSISNINIEYILINNINIKSRYRLKTV